MSCANEESVNLLYVPIPSSFPQKSIDKLAERGWMGLCIDEKNKGIGLDLLSASVIIEELSRCCASTGIIASIHNCLYAELVQRYGSSQQIEEFLKPFTLGRIGAFALSEHGLWATQFCF